MKRENMNIQMSIMKMTSRIIGLLLAGVMAVAPVAAENTFGQASDIFHVGAGARAMGMGSAFSGLADDASAPYFNPAGLALLDEHQLMAMHAPMFESSNFNYLASVHPFGDKWGAVGLSDALLMSDGFEVRDTGNNVLDSDGDLRNNAIIGSYARKLPYMNLAAGVNVKILQQKVVGFSDSSLGFDVGALWPIHRYLTIGGVLQNINEPEIKLDQEADKYRPISRLGLASEVFTDRLTLTADLIKVQKEQALYAAGAEWTVNKLLQLRAGFNENRSYTFGMGLRIDSIRVDYAFSDTDIGAFNKVSVTWAWHNIYRTEIDPPMKAGRAVYPLAGFENQVAFKTRVPNHVVSRWTLNVLNAKGETVRTLEGDLRPPEVIGWDARNSVGEPVVAGKYMYDFKVSYKNGKEWTVDGNLDLDLPNHKFEEDIDMNLELNGAQATEE